MGPNLSYPYRSAYDQVFDVIVFGGGYAGFAAATELQRQGRQVLLVERTAAILWESGWAFATTTGAGASPQWQAFLRELKRHDAASDELIDGALAEVVATGQITEQGPRVLYYVTPVAVHRDGDGLLSGVAVAAKAGVRWLRARQWVDATDEGQLLRLIDPSTESPQVTAQAVRVFFRHTRWASTAEQAIPVPELPQATVRWMSALWDNERCLAIDLPGDAPQPRLAWVPAITALREQLGEEMHRAVVTHGSVVPLPTYAQAKALGDLPPNLLCAGPTWTGANTLAGRFESGLRAAKEALSARTAPVNDPLPSDPPVRWQSQQAEVAVAGIGTGGALAALAAARAGAQVTAFDPLPFAGGIGSGGGIHYYYFGAKGGLQEELDARVRRIMPLFGASAQVMGFHPDAKKIALEQLLSEAGVHMTCGATLFGIERQEDGRVLAAHVATPGGAVRLTAPVWIDSTGDGDLAAHAGASCAFGRATDGQFHAYSQSSGRAGEKDNASRMYVVNYDAGFVDPTDEQDLTRARLVGIGHYAQRHYTALDRPTYIAPAIGLRQSRQVQTDYMLTLADLIERREFEDAVGQTGCHYDNHAVDYEFESDEAMFWVWCCRQWSGRTACQIPYRMILPQGLANVLIACRAAGVTEEAHHSFRMQRDIQRLGEIAGYAAALATGQHGGLVRDIPFEDLRRRLEHTGALRLEETADDPFGPRLSREAYNDTALAAQATQWAGQLREGAGPWMWHLYRHPRQARPLVEAALREGDPQVSWRAACVVAMWNDAAAEPRLLQAVGRREYGFDDEPEQQRPEHHSRVAPCWMVAVVLLRRCGTTAVLPALLKLVQEGSLLLNARTAIALTCQTLASRLTLSEQEKGVVAAILRELWKDEPANAEHGFQQPVLNPERPTGGDRPVVADNFLWQLHLAVAKAEEAAGLAVHPEVKAFLLDPRATVRRAFVGVTQQY